MTESAAQPAAPRVEIDDAVKLHRCPECNYDLANLPRIHTCPECGFAYDDTMFDAFIGPGAFRHASRWITFAGMLWILLLVCAGVGAVVISVTALIVLGIWFFCEIGLHRGVSTGRYRLAVLGDETRLIADSRINRSYRTREFGSVEARPGPFGGYRIKMCGARWSDPGGPLDPFVACHIDAEARQAEQIAGAIRQSVEDARERMRERMRKKGEVA